MGGARASGKTTEAGTDKQCWIAVGEGSVGGQGEVAHADEGQAIHPPRWEGWGGGGVEWRRNESVVCRDYD